MSAAFLTRGRVQGLAALSPATVESDLNVLLRIVETFEDVTEGGRVRGEDDQIPGGHADHPGWITASGNSTQQATPRSPLAQFLAMPS
jgi:hypothetical protein